MGRSWTPYRDSRPDRGVVAEVWGGEGARMIDLDCYVGRFSGRKDRRLGGTTRGGKVQHPRSSRAKVSLVAGATPGMTVKGRNVSSQKCFGQPAFPR